MLERSHFFRICFLCCKLTFPMHLNIFCHRINVYSLQKRVCTLLPQCTFLPAFSWHDALSWRRTMHSPDAMHFNDGRRCTLLTLMHFPDAIRGKAFKIREKYDFLTEINFSFHHRLFVKWFLEIFLKRNLRKYFTDSFPTS